MAEFLAVTTRRYDRFSDADFVEDLATEQQRARQLHHERTFRTIWGRADGGGVIVLMEAPSLASAEKAWASLRFVERGMIDVEIFPLVAYNGFMPAQVP